MDGVGAVLSVLTVNAPLLTLMPATRIQAGDLPIGTDLPAISVKSVSGNDRNIPAPGAYRHVVERVQVTVLAATYPSQQAVMRAVRKALADKLAVTVTGLIAVTIHTDSKGPDFMDDDATIFIGSQDFVVRYSELR